MSVCWVVGTFFVLLVLGDDVPIWEWWPPLPSTPVFTGQLVITQGHVKPVIQGGYSLDLFEKTTNPVVYGNIRSRTQQISNDNPQLQPILLFLKSKLNIKKIQIVKALKLSLEGTVNNQERLMGKYNYYGYDGDLHSFKYAVLFGVNYYLMIQDEEQVMHKFAVTLDRFRAYHLMQHTIEPPEQTCPLTSYACKSTDTLRVLTYNIWNVNPPAEVFGHSNRWKQYQKRFEHFVSFVQASDADIIGFQELRIDNTFGPIGNQAQVQQLADALPGYQYVYRSAMMYLNKRDLFERIEEGPAIFSRYPIIETDYVMLSNNPTDPNDVHQRICLHAVVAVPGWGNVDVYVTHLSLSEKAREISMLEIWEFMQQGKGVSQLLLGDLNAEPDTRGIQFLQGLNTLHGQKTNLRDIWLDLHPEPAPRSTDDIDRQHRFTFPSADPIKRIDFILLGGKGKAKSCEIIGQEPTADTKHLSPKNGMLHRKSPIWASDHRGVVAELLHE